MTEFMLYGCWHAFAAGTAEEDDHCTAEQKPTDGHYSRPARELTREVLADL